MHGTRAAVDHALSRLTRSGLINRLARGVFVRPRVSRYVGPVLPGPEAVARAVASRTGAKVQVSGAECLDGRGLSAARAGNSTCLSASSTSGAETAPTFDCRRLVDPFDPFDAAATVTAQKRYGQNLVAAMARHVREVVSPWLAVEMARQFQDTCQIELDANPEKLWVCYESALPPSLG